MSKILSQDAVDALFASGPPTGAAGAAALEEPTSEVQRYDFRHPHRISKERLRTLEAMYERLARSLEGWLMARVRGNVELALESMEQLSFGEFALALPTPCNAFLLDVRNSGGQQAVLSLGSDLAGVLVDRLFGGSGAPIIPQRGLTPIERMAVRQFADRVARGVEEIWTDHVALAFEINGFETVPEIIRAVHGDDPVLVTRYSVALSGIRSEIEFCLPLAVIDRFLLDSRDRRIESNAGSAEERRLNRIYAEETTRRVRVEVSARLPEMRLSIDHISSIRPGVVLDTGVKVDAPLELRVRDQVRFVGRATQVDDRLAIEVDSARTPDRARLRQISATKRDRRTR